MTTTAEFMQKYNGNVDTYIISLFRYLNLHYFHVQWYLS